MSRRSFVHNSEIAHSCKKMDDDSDDVLEVHAVGAGTITPMNEVLMGE